MTSYPRFKDKVVIVSGGADGMGRACSTQLAAEGARLFILDVKHDMADELARGLSKSGARAEALRADVMNESELREAIATVLRRTGGEIDSLINIAGGSASGLTAEIDLAVWDRLYALNLRSTLVACQAVIPTMRKRGGSIVTMASISGLRGDPEWAPYNAAKAAIISLTQSLAWEEGGYGIRVNAICPGPIASERMLATISQDELRAYNESCALGRIGTASELAEAILFLASDQSSFVTGAALVADGGLTARTGQPTRFYRQQREGLHRRPSDPS
jgi:meso-butanediol dehydrogenase/(S,S)-butanediol dehydrogenase/diacetyl reductase